MMDYWLMKISYKYRQSHKVNVTVILRCNRETGARSANSPLLLYLGLHHLELGGRGFLIGHEPRCPPSSRAGTQGGPEAPAVQQGLLQLGCPLGHLQSQGLSYHHTLGEPAHARQPTPPTDHRFSSFSFKTYSRHCSWAGYRQKGDELISKSA